MVELAEFGPVLVVDDDPLSRMLLVALLGKMGCVVAVATNGAEAVAAVGQSDYAAIIMDCQMPEMDGYQATRLIRSAEVPPRRVPIIARTASSRTAELQRCLDVGMDDHLAKSSTRTELESVLTHWLVVGSQPPPVGQQSPIAGPALCLDRSPLTAIRARLTELFEGMDADVASLSEQLVSSFLARVPKYLQELTIAAKAGDCSMVMTTAHGLKGAADNLAANAIGSLAGELEVLGEDEDLSDAGRLIAKLEREYSRLRDALAEPLRL